MRQSSLAFLFALWTSGMGFAVEKGHLSTIQTGDNPLGSITEPPVVARVRIPMKITSFEPVLIQSANGVKRLEHKPLSPNAYNLRATINRSNHFYLADWHVESVPIKWDRDQRLWKVELKFYKRYGQEQELEEYVGTLPVQGKLTGGEAKVFVLDAKAQQQFNNKRGSPVLIVEVGPHGPEDKGQVAKRDEPKNRN
ncbi:MAG: hypothetical protein ACOVS5_13040 [Oligoflexus sp.]|jgi:hypothetical protein